MKPIRLWLRAYVELPLVQAWERRRFVGAGWRNRLRNWRHRRAYDRTWDRAHVIGEALLYTNLSTKAHATVPIKLLGRERVATLRWTADHDVFIASVGVNHRNGKKIARYRVARALKKGAEWELELRGLA